MRPVSTAAYSPHPYVITKEVRQPALPAYIVIVDVPFPMIIIQNACTAFGAAFPVYSK
jgi:hypothetical protein